MNETIGFIGSGNMGGAMIGGIIKVGLTAKEGIYVPDINKGSLARVRESYDVSMTTDNAQLAKVCDITALSAKLFLCPVVINQTGAVVKEDVIIVAIAAGQPSEAAVQLFEREVKATETMPNTPVLVGEGMAAITPARDVIKGEITEITAIFNSLDKNRIVPECLTDTVTAVSGPSPAYAYVMAEVTADATVAEGMPGSQAYRFAAQAVLGDTQMALETGKYPGELKDMVCSPGGATTTAVAKLEKTGFRSSIMQSMKVCAGKLRKISK